MAFTWRSVGKVFNSSFALNAEPKPKMEGIYYGC